MDNVNDLESIKTKIRKLLALSKSDNENEALIALEKANELIKKYGLDEAALHFELVYVKSTKIYVPWRTLINNAVSWLYGCYSYRDCNYGNFVFIGDELYAFLAGEMYTYLVKTITHCAKKAVRKNAKYNFRRDFKYGMASCIYDRIMKLGESCSWAPQRKVKIEEAKKFIERSVKLSSNEYKKVKFNRTAVIRGALYGNDVSLARQAGYSPVPQIATINTASVQ